MSPVFEYFQKYLMQPAIKISQFKIVRAVMAAGMASIPFTIVGSFFLVLNILPETFTGLEELFDNTVFKVKDLYMIANAATMGILALYFNIVIAYELTKIEAEENNLSVNPLTGALLSVFAYFMTLPQLVFNQDSIQLLNNEKIINGFDSGSVFERLGTPGIFTAIIMAVIATQIYFVCIRRQWIIKMPEGVPEGVSRSFSALIPSFIIAFVILILNGVLVYSGTDLYKLIKLPFAFVTTLTSSWIGLMVIIFLIHALWIVGIHGANIVTPFLIPILLANMDLNVAGDHIPFAGEFNNSFVIIGGSGATLLMTFYIAFLAKSSQLKILGKASIAPGIFNINEPIIFGLPIVYNPYLALPFFLAPMLSASIAYFSIKMEIIRPIIAQIPWPSPMGLGAFIGTGGDWKAIIVALICASVAFIVYYPFITVYDRKLFKEEKIATA